MAIGSVSVTVNPDARGFVTKLKADLKDVNVKVGVKLDDTGVRARLEEIGRNKSVKVNVDVNDRGAGARLDEVARTRTAKIRADVDRGSLSRAESALSGVSSELFSLKGAAITIGPALIPATAAVVGLTGALSAPILTAGAGLGIFGAVSLAALSKAKTDMKDIAALRKQAASASTPKAAAAFLKQADDLQRSLPKSEQAFIKASHGIGTAYDGLLKKTGANVFGPLTGGADLLAKVLPKSAPIVNAFGKAITGLESDLSKYADSKAFTGFVNFLSTKGVTAFGQFAGIAGHVALGAGSIIKAFEPLGGSLLGNLEHASKGLDHIGQSKGFQHFLDYVRKVGPKVASTLGHVAGAVGRVVDALAPQGSTMLGVIDGLAKTVSKMKPGQIAAVAAAVGTFGLATHKFGRLTSLSLLVSATSYAYKHSGAFRTLADDAGKFAAAINSLPKGVKIGLGAGVAGSILASKAKSGSLGTLIPKALGGTQKVYVVNFPPGFGGPTKPGAPGEPTILPGGGSGAGGKHRAGPNETPVPTPSTSAPKHLAEDVPKGGIRSKLSKGLKFGSGLLGEGFLSSFALASFGSQPDILPARGKRLGSSVTLPRVKQLTGGSTNPSALDSSLSGLAHSNASDALLKIQAASKATGISLKDMSGLLPKTSAALGDFSKSAYHGQGANAALSKSFTSAAAHSVALTGAAKRAGLSTKEYSAKLRTLPKAVQTKITAKGADTSAAGVKRLARQYDLTPKQVRTLMQLVGADKAKGDAKGVKKGIDAIPPSKKPKVNVTTTGLGPLATAKGLIGSIKSKSVGIHVTTVYTTRGHPSAAAVARNPSLNKPAVGGYTGGYFTGHSFTRRGYSLGGPVFGAGTGTSDSINARLSDGEFVVNAAATARNRAMLEAINSGGRPRAGHYANGGPVVSHTSGGPAVFKFYDSDGVLQGIMRGVADQSMAGSAAQAATLRRQRA